MLLRSVNPVLAIPAATSQLVLVSVQYDGPVLAAALVFVRATLRNVASGAGTALTFGVGVLRAPFQIVRVNYTIPTQVLGDVSLVFWNGVLDLVPGDALQAMLISSVAGRFVLEENGMTVAIR